MLLNAFACLSSVCRPVLTIFDMRGQPRINSYLGLLKRGRK